MTRFREATPDDVAALVDLVESAYRGPRSRAGWTTEADLLDGQRTDAQEVAEVVSAPDRELLLAVGEDGTLDGCCQLARTGPDVAYFGMFAVRPPLQGSGLGSALLREAERRAFDAWHVTRMRMTVLRQRADLQAWYARRGYRCTGETEPFPYGDARFGLPRRGDLEFVVLSKVLTAPPR